ncbi:MAG: aminotransferase class V-fold PLP-dependent enzyme [Bacteroidetes bacterium]|nr:aminotransferase class V-fold PLP-dependent enzyme [Bacteroidota bacterium]
MNLYKLRADTPGTKNVIHFNNAGASLMPAPVYKAVTDYLYDEYMFGGYETADKYKKVLNEFYSNAAMLIHAKSDEIAFMENATSAWDMAFYSIPFRKGDRILTSKVEYASNFIAFLQMQKRAGVVVDIIESLPSGEIDSDALETELKKRNVKLVSITHMPTNGGVVNPVEEVGKLAEKYNALYLLDACQSAGQYPLDVNKIRCHFLSATGRKYLRGPRGTGFLYVNRQQLKTLEPVTLDLHSAEWKHKESYEIRNDAKRFEKWEAGLAGKYGLSVAIQYLLGLGIESVWDRVQYLAELMRNALQAIPGIEVLDQGKIKSGIVTFRSGSISAEEIKKRLREKAMNTSVAVRSHTLIDMEERQIDTAVRASVHYYNTEEEIETFSETLMSLLK